MLSIVEDRLRHRVFMESKLVQSYMFPSNKAATSEGKASIISAALHRFENCEALKEIQCKSLSKDNGCKSMLEIGQASKRRPTSFANWRG